MSIESLVEGDGKPPGRSARWEALLKLRDLFRETAPSADEMAQRLQTVERDVILPVKGMIVLILFYYFFLQPWYEESAAIISAVVNPMALWQTVKLYFALYVGVNIIVAIVLWYSKHLSSRKVQWVIYFSSLLDAIFVASVTYITGGFDSVAYWAFGGLIVRNAISCPRAVPQLVLNFFLSICYLMAGLLDLATNNPVLDSEDTGGSNLAEPFLLRLFLLWLLTLCFYGLQVLIEKQRRAVEEAKESAGRQAQLQAAGRLAAEIAHQIKNPLAIINNTAYSMHTALEKGRKLTADQVGIIREEVEKADKIITQLMGYAQLAEGQVERLEFADELNRALLEVFPPAAHFPVTIEKQMPPALPPLLMQKIHLAQILVNVLQNAREALNGQGRIRIAVEEAPDQTILVHVTDSGPGIAADRIERIFEPYFSTKQKGSGLGLAIARHNIEMYGGSIRAESELGQGAVFVLSFPTRTFMKQQA